MCVRKAETGTVDFKLLETERGLEEPEVCSRARVI